MVSSWWWVDFIYWCWSLVFGRERTTRWLSFGEGIIVFGCPDLRAGAAGSLMNLLQNSALNHRCEITAGVMHEECANLLQSFFRAKRNSDVARSG